MTNQILSVGFYPWFFSRIIQYHPILVWCGPGPEPTEHMPRWIDQKSDRRRGKSTEFWAESSWYDWYVDICSSWSSRSLLNLLFSMHLFWGCYILLYIIWYNMLYVFWCYMFLFLPLKIASLKIIVDCMQFEFGIKGHSLPMTNTPVLAAKNLRVWVSGWLE